MNYCVYFKETGRIYSATNKPIDTDEFDYIEISPDLMREFLTLKRSLHEFTVIPDYTIPHSGRLVSTQELNQQWSRRDDIVYLLPFGQHSDFTITQDQTTKTCVAKISAMGLATITNRKLTNIIVAACPLDNPYLPLWVWNINPHSPNTFTYQGTDNIRFYTKRILDSYAHEQI